MNQRKLIGVVALALLLLLALAIRYVAGIPRDDWNPLWAITYVVALCVALFMAFYDQKNFPEKAWDFNPKRGAFYFLLGWLIFPMMMLVEVISGADFSLGRMVLGTLCMSVFIGIAGTFTENVGV